MAFRVQRFLLRPPGTLPFHQPLPWARCHVSLPSGAVPVPAAAPVPAATPQPAATPVPASPAAPARPLQHLTLAALLRTLLITHATGTPRLQRLVVRLLAATGTQPWLAPERNSLVRAVLRATLGRHFCAGATPAEVAGAIAALRDQGVGGVLLSWAHEGGDRPVPAGARREREALGAAREGAEADIARWRAGCEQTVAMTPPGQFAVLKLTGTGPDVTACLAGGRAPPPAMREALHALCQAALARGVHLVVDAEQTAVQRGIDAWTLELQQQYNRQEEQDSSNESKRTAGAETQPPAIVYGTYQAYLRRAPTTLAAHLAAATHGRFALGVKLVRGAYLATDARAAIWTNKAATDRAYDGLAAALLRRRYEGPLAAAVPSGATAFPGVRLILATHNLASARAARAVQREQMREQRRRGGAEPPPVPLVHAQLLGMADHVTGELLLDADGNDHTKAGSIRAEERDGAAAQPRLDVAKYMVWGSVAECTRYFVRRAEENGEAAARTSEERRALWAELGRRLRGR